MNYKELQMGGDIIKPIHYHIGEWKALQFYSRFWKPNFRFLDVGCGIGYGVGMLNKLGFNDVFGIDLNPEKVSVGSRLGYEVAESDIFDFSAVNFYDVIWCSHSFEHMEDADSALEHLKLLGKRDCKFYFILPYPDLSPAPAHCSSTPLGLDIDDAGATVVKWFIDRGMFTQYRFDNFREPEIWINCERNEYSNFYR